jgi:hypothetical protein
MNACSQGRLIFKPMNGDERTMAVVSDYDPRCICIVFYPEKRIGKKSDWSDVSRSHAVHCVSYRIVMN